MSLKYEPKREQLKRLERLLYLKAKARSWPCLSYMCHVRSTADHRTPPQIPRNYMRGVELVYVLNQCIIPSMLCAHIVPHAWKREFKFPWREAGPPNHLKDKVDSDQ